MANLKQEFSAYDSAQASLQIAYNDLAEIKTAHAEEIKKEINALIDRCALAAVLLQDMYNDNV